MIKNLTLVCVAFVVLPYLAYCQSTNPPTDTIVYGNIEHNYPGGQAAYSKYLSESGSYPEPAKSIGIQGTVYIRFIIEKDSTLSNIHLCDGIGSGTEDLAVRLIMQSGKWMPSRINGVNVRTRCIVPIRFLLSADELGADDGPVSKNGIYGITADTSHFNKIIRIESLGIPVTEASEHLNKNIRFMGKIYAAKALSDTVFIVTCGDLNQYSKDKYVNVVFAGEKAVIKDLAKKAVADCLITGIGFVISRKSIPAIIVNDDKEYRILKPSSARIHGIYDFVEK